MRLHHFFRFYNHFNSLVQWGLCAVLLIGFSPSWAQNCPVQLQVTYSDGEKGCLTDLPIAKTIGKGWGRATIQEVVQGARFYTVAASATCSDVTITLANHLAHALAIRSAESAVGLCSRGCDCSVVINNGHVQLTKSLAMALGAHTHSDVASSSVLETQKLRVEKLREQQLADEAKLREREQINKQTQIKEQEQLALAEKLRQEQKFEEETKLKEQVRLSQEAKRQEEMRLAEVARLRQEQLRVESDKLKEDARLEQEARLKDRELLLQLTAELARLRSEAAAAKPVAAAVSVPAPITVAAPAAPEPLPIFANRKALVIGNDNYKFVSKLANAKEDAKVMAESLTNVGYKVTLKLDLSEKEMKAALRGFKTQVEAGDEVAFFYAGHGVQLANSNYLVPVDVAGEGEEQMKDEGISLQRILDDMSEKKAKFTLAMIDACRDNPFKTNGRAIGGNGRGLAPTTAATGQMVVFSAGTGQQALDKLGPNDKDKNGLFTRIFVREMQKPGVSVDRVVRSVRGEVVNMAKSVGHEQVPAIYDQVVGEFYFRK